MFEKWRIKEHMEVTDASGVHVGTVDSVDDGRIKLTRTDSGDGGHHFIDIDAVDKIDDNRVYLKEGTPLPTGTDRAPETVSGGAGTLAGAGDTAGSAAGTRAGNDAVNYGGSAGATDLPGTEGKLFGTSGTGTGMGGSGLGEN